MTFILYVLKYHLALNTSNFFVLYIIVYDNSFLNIIGLEPSKSPNPLYILYTKGSVEINYVVDDFMIFIQRVVNILKHTTKRVR